MICLPAALAVSCGGSRTGHAGFSGEDMTGIVEIHREKETKSASVEVKEDMEWTLYAGPSVEQIDLSSYLCQYRADGTFPLEVPREGRSYFQLETPRGSAILAERHLPMEGGYNFRDLGGYRTTEGRYVKWGKFIRSDDMKGLTDSDLRYLASIPIRTVVDFRTEMEVELAPDRHPATVENSVALTVNPGNIIGVPDGEITTSEHAVQLMEQMYRLMVSDQGVIEQYRRFFALLQEEKNIPLLYHCSAGKDRTGMASALILYALGVDSETVMKDYLLSNHYLGDKYASAIEAAPAARPMMEIQPSYLQAGLDEIKKLYGSVESYLTEQLKVDIPAFRDKYLY